MPMVVRKEILDLKDYVPGKSPAEAGVIKLSSNENPFGPSPAALEAILREAKNLHRYPDQKSILLREALARHQTVPRLAKNVSLPEECFIVGNGSDEIMQIAAATFLNPGEEVIIPKNSFSIYEFVTRLFSGKAVLVGLKDNRIDLGTMAAAATSKTKMIFLCNPHNPTGTIFTTAEFENFLKKVPEEVIVVVDEAYQEFAEAKDFPQTLQYVKEKKNLIILRTFSKFFGLAGVRVGYGIANKELINYLFRAKLPFNVNRVAQAAAAAALGDKEFQLKTFKNNVEGKNFLYLSLQTLGAKLSFFKTEANFIFIETKKPADDLFIDLMKQKVIIRPLTSFGFPKAIRVSIGTLEQNERFIAALSASL